MAKNNRKDNKLNNSCPPACFIIVDGMGISKNKIGNAYYQSGNLFIKKIVKEYPTSILETHGKAVGLPRDIVGSSEVGHTNLGAGRMVEQDITIINKEIKNKSFFKNPVILKAMKKAKKNNSALHFMGLLSDGNVHSNTRHLFALLDMAKKEKVKRVFIHVFTDGQDVDPISGINYIRKLINKTRKIGIGKIATISGRYYAMDRVERWSRISGVHKAIAEGIDHYQKDPIETLKKFYEQKIYDQFIPPTVFVDDRGKPIGKVEANDSVIFFNLRSDRARALTKTFVKPEALGIKNHPKKLKNLYFVALTNFGEDLPVKIAYNRGDFENTLPKAIADSDHIRQLYVAESEKFPHITYFFHGLSSKPLRNENRIKIDSKNIPTYDLDPSMSAEGVFREVVDAIDRGICEFIGVNFANPDMLGHTGNLKATIKGLQFVDKKIRVIVNKILKKNGYIFLVSDHGNCDEMIDPKTKRELTSHTKNPVYFSIISNRKDIRIKKNGRLSNAAPTVLKVLEIKKPKGWDKDLIINK